MKYAVYFLILICLAPKIYAQKTAPVPDSTEVYKKIEDYSKKSRFTKMLHKWVFRPANSKRDTDRIEKPKNNYIAFEGKIIRNIIIETHDPFGFSFTDSTKRAKSWFEKTGNNIHIKSKNLAIRNFLLIKENEVLDTLMMAESARLLRSQNYVREIEFRPTMVSKDSVDITIVSLDSWSLVPKASFSSSKTRIKLRERNFIGTGHQVDLGFSKKLETGNDGYNAEYTVPNFLNTFVSATGRYNRDFDGYYNKTISFDREFYSPFTRWAGGIFLEERFLRRFLPNDTFALTIQDFKFLTQDYWGGHAIPIFKGDSERERTTNLILSARTLLVNYRETPTIEYDPIQFFSDERLFLGSIGVSSRQFIQDKFIFRDGPMEDVPVGTLYSVTAGMQRKNHKSRMYLGAQISYGNYFSWGFISTNLEAGTFFNGSKTEQTAFSFQANYFTNLLSLGKGWKMRQFVKPQLIIGVNRLDSYGDRVSLNEDPEFNGPDGNLYSYSNMGSIQGFESFAVGTRKYVLSMQTQFYSPWEFWGFRLNPYLQVTAGILSKEDTRYGSEKLLTSIGGGFIIRNDYLVFSSFQFSFAYYPQMPGQGNSIFKTNVFDTDDFGFQDFQIGKPRPLKYE